MIHLQEWKHVFKLDPDKLISDEDLELLCESATDAIIVGGTQGITFENTIELLGRIRRYEIPCVLEVSKVDAVVPGYDHYLLPFVLNAMDPDWIIKPHQQAVKQFGSMIPWEDVTMLGYCVMNGSSAVAKLTKSDSNLEGNDVLAYARVAQHLLKLPVFYVEYSGTYADVELVKQLGERLQQESSSRGQALQLFYGGGIDTQQKAKQMKSLSDTIVVGNVIYEDIQAALATTWLKESE